MKPLTIWRIAFFLSVWNAQNFGYAVALFVLLWVIEVCIECSHT